MKGMPEEIKRRLDAVLEKVKEPETGRSLAELNLVSRFRYSDSQKVLQVFMNIGEPKSTCLVCSIVNSTLAQSIERDLQHALEDALPDLTIELIH